MPKCGSQVILCDLPIRFDTYAGCSHACSYCFANRNRDIRQVSRAESATTLRKFVSGQRSADTTWCDWDIPLHWGGMSDPFQPIERKEKVSLECLKVFAETQYPFVVSTKNALIAEEPYLSLIKQCNCVVQFSAVCPSYDAIERGASTFEQRLAAAAKIAPFKRVNFRVQPYITDVKNSVKNSLMKFRDVGGHGAIFEGMKYLAKHEGTIKKGGDWCYPSQTLARDFVEFRDILHNYGMKFYCGENRLRGMSDELCCCGIEGMGWRSNKANLNHYIFDRHNFTFTERMAEPETYKSFKCLYQDALTTKVMRGASYRECMLKELREPRLRLLIPDNYKIK